MEMRAAGDGTSATLVHAGSMSRERVIEGCIFDHTTEVKACGSAKPLCMERLSVIDMSAQNRCGAPRIDGSSVDAHSQEQR
jgi:hypothetical protein